MSDAQNIGGTRPSARLNVNNYARAVAGVNPTDIYHIQLVRSLLVSIVALAVNLALSVEFKNVLGVYYILAAAAGYCAGVGVNYYLSVEWVFAHRKLKSRGAEFSIFVLINLIGLVLNTLMVAALVEWFGLDYILSLIIATAGVFFWNFLARKKFLY